MPKASSTVSSVLSPPPTSDVDAVLTWATHLAAKASHSSSAAGSARQTNPTNTIDVNDPYAQLAPVLETLRAHLATSVPKPQTRLTRRLGRPKDTDFVEDNAEVLEAEAALTLGKRIVSCSVLLFVSGTKAHTQNVPCKPCLSDFPGFRCHIVSNAIPNLVATLITQGAYEVYSTASQWANKSYSRRWSNEIPHEPFQPAPRALLGIVSTFSTVRLPATDAL